MRTTRYILALLGAAIGFTACEDTIDVKVPEGKTLTVVDAWITNVPGKQSIRIISTAPYTSTQKVPVITNATVTLTDLTDNSTYAFTYSGTDSLYSHDPGAGVSIGKLNHAYKLRVELPSGTFEGIDTIRNVPEIDSINYEFKLKDEAISGKEGYYARFYARDLKGQVDYYWIRSYRNGKKESDAFAINGSMNENVADGSQFIVPISEGITRDEHPYLLHDKITVRIASCTKASHTFLTHVESQLDSGGLFAVILQNVRSNMYNTNPSSPEKVLGWFGTSAVKFKEKTVE